MIISYSSTMLSNIVVSSNDSQTITINSSTLTSFDRVIDALLFIPFQIQNNNSFEYLFFDVTKAFLNDHSSNQQKDNPGLDWYWRWIYD